MATSEGIPSSIDIEFLELNDNPYFIPNWGNLSFFFYFPLPNFPQSLFFLHFAPSFSLFIYFLKSLCFNDLCSFVKMRVKALRSKRTLNK